MRKAKYIDKIASIAGFSIIEVSYIDRVVNSYYGGIFKVQGICAFTSIDLI